MKLERIGVFVILVLTANLASSQETIRLTSDYGSNDSEIQDLISFENIFVEKLNFQSEKLKGKYYKIDMEEFVNGHLTNTSNLFDGSETDYFKIDTDIVSLKFFFKLNDGKLKTYVIGSKFGSKKSYFKLNSDADKYSVKGFFGSREEIYMEVNKKIAIFAIITPTIHKDGSGSYCEVAQSEVRPEKLGEHFRIPHYFLITIRFE